MSLRRWVTFLDTLEPLRYAGLFDARRLLVTGAVPADDAVAGVRPRRWPRRRWPSGWTRPGSTCSTREAHEKAIRRFTAASRAVREHLTTALPAQVLGTAAVRRGVGQRAGRRAAAGAGQAAPRAGRARAAGAVRRADHRGHAVRAGVAGLGGPVLPGASPASSTWSCSTRRRRSGWPTRSARWAGRAPPSSSATRKQMPPTSFAEPTAGGDESIDLAETRGRGRGVDPHRVRAGAGAAAVAVVALPQPGRVADRVQQRRSTTRTGCRRSRRRRTGGRRRSRTAAASRWCGCRARSTARTPGGCCAPTRSRPRRSSRRSAGGSTWCPSGTASTSSRRSASSRSTPSSAPTSRRCSATPTTTGWPQALDRTDGEGLFVKNLENVQGDERDVVFFSTGFSPNADGDAAAELRPAEPGRRRAAAERRDHPCPAAGRRLLVVRPGAAAGRGDVVGRHQAPAGLPRHGRAGHRRAAARRRARRRWSTGTARRSPPRCASAGWSCAPTSGSRSSGSTCRSLDLSIRRHR